MDRAMNFANYDRIEIVLLGIIASQLTEFLSPESNKFGPTRPDIDLSHFSNTGIDPGSVYRRGEY